MRSEGHKTLCLFFSELAMVRLLDGDTELDTASIDIHNAALASGEQMADEGAPEKRAEDQGQPRHAEMTTEGAIAAIMTKDLETGELGPSSDSLVHTQLPSSEPLSSGSSVACSIDKGQAHDASHATRGETKSEEILIEISPGKTEAEEESPEAVFHGLCLAAADTVPSYTTSMAFGFEQEAVEEAYQASLAEPRLCQRVASRLYLTLVMYHPMMLIAGLLGVLSARWVCFLFVSCALET
jgi:hypothetical protein